VIGDRWSVVGALWWVVGGRRSVVVVVGGGWRWLVGWLVGWLVVVGGGGGDVVGGDGGLGVGGGGGVVALVVLVLVIAGPIHTHDVHFLWARGASLEQDSLGCKARGLLCKQDCLGCRARGLLARFLRDSWYFHELQSLTKHFSKNMFEGQGRRSCDHV